MRVVPVRKCWGLTMLLSERGKTMAGCKLEPEKFKLELKYRILTGWCLSRREKKKATESSKGSRVISYQLYP